MPLTHIYLCRHGYRLNWTVDPITGTYTANVPTPTGIPNDPVLSSYGVQQSLELAEKIATLDPLPTLFYSSPFYRCLQTIRPAYDVLIGKDHILKPLRVDTGVGEFFGRARFHHPLPASVEVLREHFDFIEDHSTVRPWSEGELSSQLHYRFAYALHRIIEQADREGATAIIICTHAAGMIVMGRALTGNMPDSLDEEDFRCGTCALSTFRRRGLRPADATAVEQWDPQNPKRIPFVDWTGNGVQGGWDCVSNGDCSFLKNGEERTWRFTGDESFMHFPDKGESKPIVMDGTRGTKL